MARQSHTFSFAERVKLFCCTSFLFAVLMLGTVSCADPWKENVPDFEVCSMEELPKSQAKPENRNYLMWWTLLGVIPAEKQVFSPAQEAVLSGRSQAPASARFHHFLFQKKQEKAVAPGEIHFSRLFRNHKDYRKRSKFYACISLRCSRSIPEAVLIGKAAGDLTVWLNGQKVLEHGRGIKEETAIGKLALRSGFNRIVVRYIDKTEFDPDKRVFSLRFTGKEGNLMFVR